MRYYDVTLSAAGTTTLSSAVTTDRFTIINLARLNVASTGALTSLIDVTQTGGVVQVYGPLTSAGDYFLMMGGLAGSCRINAPFFTNAVAMIAPGMLGGIGTLTFGGNVVLTSGSTLLIDVRAGGTSDRIAVASTTFDATGKATDGLAQRDPDADLCLYRTGGAGPDRRAISSSAVWRSRSMTRV